MNLQVDVERFSLAHKAVRAELLAERAHRGHWVGQLASSPLATAAAISALVTAHRRDTGDTLRDSLAGDGQVIEQLVQGDLSELLCESVQWLARHQNSDGGWGDCDTAQSNLAATMLVEAAFRLTGVPAKYADLIARADAYITAQGGPAALRRSHARDKTVVAAILANCALAGIVPWRRVPTLPFELICLPKRWRRYVQLPYPSYAVPALLAVGRAKHCHKPSRNPLLRLWRRSMQAKCLVILESLQSADDSFLGSTPLTALVVTNLASIGCQDHTIVHRGIEYLLSSVRGDASWSIESNHAITNTALAIDALAEERPAARRRAVQQSALQPGPAERRGESREATWQDTARAGDTLTDESLYRLDSADAAGAESRPADADSPTHEDGLKWILENQRLEIDPLTQAPPGGWGWSDAPGSLPNTVSTSTTLVALAHGLWNRAAYRERLEHAVRTGLGWLLNLQHDDGGWPTYANEGADRLEENGADVTAQALCALAAWQRLGPPGDAQLATRIAAAIERGWQHLASQQREDGRFVPLWFGNEQQPDDANPVYGTAQVLITCGELERLDTELARRAGRWLVSAQHSTGGWGPPRARRDYSGAEKDGFRAWRANDTMAKQCSVEETALAVSALLPLAATDEGAAAAASAGIGWLASAVEQDAHRRPAVVGFYRSKLWYHERLYPLVFACGALERVRRQIALEPHEVARVG